MKEVRSPKYLQLYHRLRRDIIEGRYRYREKMPSKRTLAEEQGVSVITIEHCYELLLEEGYLLSRERSGFYVSYRKEELFPGMPEETGNAGRGSERGGQLPPLPEEQLSSLSSSMQLSELRKMMRRVLTNCGEEILMPCPSKGVPSLREAIADYLRRNRNIIISAEQIVVGSGAEYLYSLIPQMVGTARPFGIEEPSYPKIERVYREHGVSLQKLPMGRDGIESAALSSAEIGLLHVTPFHSFPSAVTASAKKRREYLYCAKQKDAVIVEDDYDSEFSRRTRTEDTLFSLDPQERVIYINSFSKTIAPSFRMAYMVLPERHQKEYFEKISYLSCTVPVFEQLVIREILRSGAMERHINRVRREMREARTEMSRPLRR